jgi:hypothetical protein
VVQALDHHPLGAHTSLHRAGRRFADGARIGPKCQQCNSVGAAAKIIPYYVIMIGLITEIARRRTVGKEQ